MNYIKHKYGNPIVFITENGTPFVSLFRLSEDIIELVKEVFHKQNYIVGMDDGNSIFKSLEDALKDEKRIRYFNGYLENLAAAIK